MPNTRVTDWLKSWPLALLPHHLLSRLVRSATRWRVRWWKNLIMQLFIRHFRVDMSEAVNAEPDAYPDFNSFFTRALRDGIRPQPDEPLAIACPVDGAISEMGRIRGGQLLQAKGLYYQLVARNGSKTNSSLAVIASDIYLDMQETSSLIARTREEISRATLMEQLNQSFGIITPEIIEVVGGVKSILFGDADAVPAVSGPPPGTVEQAYRSPLEQ